MRLDEIRPGGHSLSVSQSASLPKPEFVYFDLGNVLLNFDHEIACVQIARICDRTSDEIRNVIFESDLQERYEAGDVTTDEFFEQFCATLGVNPDKQEILLAASAIFSPNYSIMPLVSQLRLAGTRTGILSNTCEAHWLYITDGRYRFVSEMFRWFALSYELKSSKPDPLIYQRAAELVGFPPEQIFFVDDKPENVAGAQAAGFDAVLFEGSRQLLRDLVQRGLLASI